MTERWRPVEGYEGLYRVSDMGRVTSITRRYLKPKKFELGLKRGRVLRTHDSRGYCLVDLYKQGRRETLKVHRLVAKAFVPNPQGKPQVNHRDGDRANNRAENLEWVTNDENARHAKGLRASRRPAQ